MGHTPANCLHTELLITFLLPPSSLPMAFVDLGFPQQLTSAAQLCWLVLSVVVLAEWKSQKASTGGFLAPVTGLASSMAGCALQTRSAPK